MTAVSGKGTLFNRWDGSAWVNIGDINSIGGPSSSRETIDVTTLGSTGGYREFIGSLRDGGDLSLSMNFESATYAIMKTDFESDTVQDYQIVLPDSVNTSIELSGLVKDLPIDIPLDDKITCDVSIKVSGQPDLTTVDVIDSVETLANITGMAAGDATQLADATLPTTVEVTYDDDTTADPAVVWDAGTPLWDGSTAGTYVFAGTITCVTGVINPDAVKASQSIVITA